jgi:phosphosulfolactate synthase (CoM biosynthesis protein A)
MPNPTTHDNDRAFPLLRLNDRPRKPRERRITEIRGPYYTPMGTRYLEDILDTVGWYVDSLKFAGGSFSLMPRKVVKGLVDLCPRLSGPGLDGRIY